VVSKWDLVHLKWQPVTIRDPFPTYKPCNRRCKQIQYRFLNHGYRFFLSRNLENMLEICTKSTVIGVLTFVKWSFKFWFSAHEICSPLTAHIVAFLTWKVEFPTTYLNPEMLPPNRGIYPQYILKHYPTQKWPRPLKSDAQKLSFWLPAWTQKFCIRIEACIPSKYLTTTLHKTVRDLLNMIHKSWFCD
jgi:hypothetical protein